MQQFDYNHDVGRKFYKICRISTLAMQCHSIATTSDLWELKRSPNKQTLAPLRRIKQLRWGWSASCAALSRSCAVQVGLLRVVASRFKDNRNISRIAEGYTPGDSPRRTSIWQFSAILFRIHCYFTTLFSTLFVFKANAMINWFCFEFQIKRR